MNSWWPFSELLINDSVDAICQIIAQAMQGHNDANLVKPNCKFKPGAALLLSRDKMK